MRRAVVPILACSMVVAATACGGDEERPTEPDEQPSPRVTAVEVEPSSAELNAIGVDQDFEATARDQDGDPMSGVDLSWSVGTDSVASVDGNGTVTSAANGTTAVVAEADGIADSATLVVEQEVTTVAVSPDSVRSEVIGSAVELEAMALDRNDQPVKAAEFEWSSSDTTVAVVDDDGVATTTGEGSASVTASVEDVRGSARLVVRLPADRLVGDFAGPGDSPHTKLRPDVAVSPRRVIVSQTGFGGTLYTRSGSRLDAGGFNVVRDSARAGTKTRVVFDPDSERFFMVGGTGPASEDEPGQFLLLVSRTSDPSDFSEQNWHGFVIEADPEGAVFDEAHPARPRIGVSRNAVVLESFMAESQGPGDPCFTRIVILDKEMLLNGRIGEKTEIDVGKAPDQYCPSLVPVKFSQGSPLFVAWTGELEVWGVQNPLAEPTLEKTVVAGGSGTFTGGEPPDAPQPETGQELVNFRDITAQPVRAGDVVWTAGTKRVETDVGPRSGVQWVQLDVSDWPASAQVVTSGLFSSEHYALYPAIAGNAEGDFTVVYGRSSEEEFPSLYHRYSDGAWPGDSISRPQLLKEGEASLTTGEGRIPYGDYFGASLDPTDRSAWLVGEYVMDPGSTGAWVGKVGF